MTETHSLFESAIKAIGAKKVANALNLSLAMVYRLAQPTIATDPEGQGCRNDADRLEALFDVLAAHPAGRPVLIQFREYFAAVFDRALGDWRPERLTRDRLAIKTARVVHEFGDFLQECHADMDPERLQKEGAEAIEAIQRLMRAASLGIEKEGLRQVG